ncbi:MAG: hypothetical protein M1821_006529 [Bathelium mastoideum]|nr:MAG: hypothetical protein M1821_006529 [Bathelium mastoideum]KAI9693806.1 MAG: hypothetical protein M1822_003077 [Bathelium mastoideum]
MDEEPRILRPLPRRPFDLQITPASNSPSSTPPLQPFDQDSPNGTEDRRHRDRPSPTSPSRSMSTLNLTASTLFGIYAPTAYDTNTDGRNTPWGTGAQTPAAESDSVAAMRRDLDSVLSSQGGSNTRGLRLDNKATSQGQGNQIRHARRKSSIQSLRTSVVPTTTRLLALFAFGVAYGLIVSKLHENRHVAPVQVEGLKRGWAYLAFWGVAGIGLGSLLPWIDWVWARSTENSVEQVMQGRDSVVNRKDSERGRRRSRTSSRQQTSRDAGALGADWNLVVRSIGAFIGIAFAIRKTPWQSTLQLSLTLALVNPVLWYLLDRSKSGFIISTVVGLTGTAVLLGINPEIVPSPAPHANKPSFLSSLSQTSNHTAYTNGAGRAANRSALGEDVLLGGFTTAESIGVATWIASVLFCSSICFGNIGRKLA